MKLLDLTFPTPAENLACDEALLELCEKGVEEEILRFWEPRTYFVVLGYANRVGSEVNERECEMANIPILRRCSGGGTVLQGPGGLNYALILRIGEGGPLRSVSSANRFIMETNRAALQTLLPGNRLPAVPPAQAGIADPGATITVQGHTDLAIGALKFSGNAQRRLKRCLLFHGSILLNCDFAIMEKVLPMPSKQPGYRRNRAHREFLAGLNAPAKSVKESLRRAWRACEPLDDPPCETIALLARDKYETSGWNLRFR